jgi:transcriptional regulator with XRE-family HTH domain
MNNTQTFGARVRFARQQNKMTLEVLSDKIGLTKQALYCIEKGITKKTGAMMALVDALGVTPEWLILGKGSMTKEDESMVGIRATTLSNMSELERLREVVQVLSNRVTSLENMLYFGGQVAN